MEASPELGELGVSAEDLEGWGSLNGGEGEDQNVLAAPQLPYFKDNKSALNCFIQRYTKKTVTKGDIEYNVIKCASQFQVTVTLHLVDGLQFAGEVAGNIKEAEQNAARVTLQHFTEEAVVLLAQPGSNPSKKRKVADAWSQASTAWGAGHGGGGGGAPWGGDPWGAFSWGANLWGGGDGGGGTSCGDSCPAGPAAGPGRGKGAVTPPAAAHHAPSAAQAAQGAAQGGAPAAEADSPKQTLNNALMRILRRSLKKEDVVFTTAETAMGFQSTCSIPGLGEEWSGMAWAGECAAQKKEAEHNSAAHAVDALAADPELGRYVTGAPPAKAQKTDAGGSKGARAEPLPRERVSQEPLIGTICKWQQRFGWIMPDEPIDHPAMVTNKPGTVYFHFSDWYDDANQKPAEGNKVSFHLAANSSGLIGEEVTPLPGP